MTLADEIVPNMALVPMSVGSWGEGGGGGSVGRLASIKRNAAICDSLVRIKQYFSEISTEVSFRVKILI